jgi:hypothetical protein
VIRDFDLPLLDDTDDFRVYDLGIISLHADIAISAELEVFEDSFYAVEVHLIMDDNEPGDLREELTTETEAAILALLARKGITAINVSPREPGAQQRDLISFNVTIE